MWYTAPDPKGEALSPQLASLLIQFLNVVMYVIIARALLSWFIHDPNNPLMKLLATLTDPFMAPLSKFLTFGGLDLSPMLAIGIIWVLQQLIVRSVGMG